MKIDRQFFSSPVAQLMLVASLLALGALTVRWQFRQRQTAPLPSAPASGPVSLPRTFTREGARFPQPTRPAPTTYGPAPTTGKMPAGSTPSVPAKPPALPLTLFAQVPPRAPASVSPVAPYGRLIPCETIIALESNRLDTPVIGLVTEDVWHGGRLVVPAGAEVHGRAAIDRTRERLAAQGAWRIIWRTPGPENGTELAIQGIALDREYDNATGRWGPHDGSAGLRGEIVKTHDDRELRLFAATFLTAATGALQSTRVSAGLVGEASVPLTTVRNATLAGAGAILHQYAQQMREAIARDGFYLRVPAGKPFYLYVTETLDRGPRPQPAPPPAHS